jgi:hypothetical protein
MLYFLIPQIQSHNIAGVQTPQMDKKLPPANVCPIAFICQHIVKGRKKLNMTNQQYELGEL